MWQKLATITLLLVGLLLCGMVTAGATTVTIGNYYMADGLNPFVEWSAVAIAADNLIYDSLYQMGPGGEFIPNLFSDLTVSEDGMTYTFEIRKGIKFADGIPLTARDVAFTYNMIIDNELGVFTTGTNPLKTVKALDDRTVEIVLKEFTNENWLVNNSFAVIPVVPKHIWESKSKEEILEKNIPVEDLVGSGPYQVAQFKPDEFIRFKKNTMWNSIYEGELLVPVVDTVVFKGYANSSAMLEDLKAGAIEVAWSVPEKTVDNLEKDPNISLEALPAVWVDEIIFNSYTPAYEEGREEHPHPALQDVELRRALAWTVDQKMLAQVAHGQYGIPANAWLPTFYEEWRNTDLPWRGYDLDKARSILDEAGYHDNDGNGIREMKSGKPLKFDVWVTSSLPYEADMAELWAQAAKKVGIKLNVSVMDSGTLWSKMPPDYKFDIATWDWGGDYDPESLLNFLICEQVSTSGWSDSGYCNEEYDQLYHEQKHARSFEKRKELIWKLQEIIYEDMPYIPMCYQAEIDAWRNDKVTIGSGIIDPIWGVMGRPFVLNVAVKS